MKKIILVLFGIFFLVGFTYAVDWGVINNRDIPLTEVTNIDKEVNYVEGGCLYVYYKGESVKISMFSSPTTKYIEYKDYKNRTIERWYGSYEECKSFIWSLTKQLTIEEGKYVNWKVIE